MQMSRMPLKLCSQTGALPESTAGSLGDGAAAAAAEHSLGPCLPQQTAVPGQCHPLLKAADITFSALGSCSVIPESVHAIAMFMWFVAAQCSALRQKPFLFLQRRCPRR